MGREIGVSSDESSIVRPALPSDRNVDSIITEYMRLSRKSQDTESP